MNGPGDQFLARAALAGDQHRQVVALHPLDLLDHARHGRARGEEAGDHRFERSIERPSGGHGRRSIAGRAQRVSLAGDGRNHADPAHHGMSNRTR
jgi:hypothetical protein